MQIANFPTAMNSPDDPNTILNRVKVVIARVGRADDIVDAIVYLSSKCGQLRIWDNTHGDHDHIHLV